MVDMLAKQRCKAALHLCTNLQCTDLTAAFEVNLLTLPYLDALNLALPANPKITSPIQCCRLRKEDQQAHMKGLQLLPVHSNAESDRDLHLHQLCALPTWGPSPPKNTQTCLLPVSALHVHQSVVICVPQYNIASANKFAFSGEHQCLTSIEAYSSAFKIHASFDADLKCRLKPCFIVRQHLLHSIPDELLLCGLTRLQC